MRADYLDHLAGFLHCGYLSDLRRIRITPEQEKALRETPVDEFSKQAYYEAVFYIMGQHVDGADSLALKQVLLEWMRNH